MSGKKRFKGKDEDLRERVSEGEPFDEDPAGREVVEWLAVTTGNSGTDIAAGTDTVVKCGAIFLDTLSEKGTRMCGQQAVKMFDEGKSGGYPVCAECAKSCHPRRLTQLRIGQNRK